MLDFLLSIVVAICLLYAFASIASMDRTRQRVGTVNVPRVLAGAAGACLIALAAFAFMFSAEDEDDSTADPWAEVAVPAAGMVDVPILWKWEEWVREHNAESVEASPGAVAVSGTQEDVSDLGLREVCNDGWLSESVGKQGRCSSHGGASGRVGQAREVRTVITDVVGSVWRCGDGRTLAPSRVDCQDANSRGWTLWPFDSDNYHHPTLLQAVVTTQESRLELG